MKTLPQISLFIALTLSSMTVAATQTDGQAYFNQGQFERAVQAWDEVLSTPSCQTKCQIDTSVRLSAAYVSLGRLKQAFKVLDFVRPLAANDPVREASVLMQLSDVYLAMRDFKDKDFDWGWQKIRQTIIPSDNETDQKAIITKEDILKKAEDTLKKAADLAMKPLLLANISNKNGNILMAREKYAEALDAYKKSVNLSIQAGDKLLSAKAAINRVQASVKYGNKTIQKLFDKAWQQMKTLPNSPDKAFALISLEPFLFHFQSSSHQKQQLRTLLKRQLYVFKMNQDNLTLSKTRLKIKLLHSFNKNSEFFLKAQKQLEKEAQAWLVEEKNVEKPDDVYAKVLKTKNAINSISAEVKNSKNHQSQIEKTFKQALQRVEKLPESHDKAFALISLVKLLPHLQAFPKTHSALSSLSAEKSSLANELLSEAIKVAEVMKDNRSIAYAKGYMAELYAQEDRYPEAIRLTREAIYHAHNPNTLKVNRSIISNENCDSNTCPYQTGLQSYPELLYSLEWQLGKLLKQYAKHQKTVIYKNVALESAQRQVVIDAYQRAKTHLQSVMKQYRCDGPQPFLQQAETFYSELTGFLLRQAAQAPVAKKQALLKEAIDSIEFLKETELQNYFHDVCVTKKLKDKLDDKYVPRHTAIFYPVILDDRLELLLTFHDGSIKQVEVKMPSQELKQKAQNFWEQLSDQQLAIKDDSNYLTTAKKLYKWLIEPISTHLKDIKTLVIVPDSDLFRLPFAALYDESDKGGKYLIEKKYALAISPAWELTDMRVIPRRHISALLMGLKKSQAKEAKKFGELSYVDEELENITQALGGSSDTISQIMTWLTRSHELLKDETFTISNVKASLRNTPYFLVHFTTHGHFDSEADNTFLVAYDKLLKLNQLETLLNSPVFKEQPVELLTLSACESALGAEQGLAGVAIKTGARSALATLWKVNDKSTADLMDKFYEHFIKLKSSKALALQEAQRELLKYDITAHPYYWAPFVLIGNWR